MIFEFELSEYFMGDKLDESLANGWFRDGNMLSRYELIYFKRKVNAVVPLRVDLDDYQFSKGQRKLLQKNNRKFRTVIRPFSLSAEKEELYQMHKNRFDEASPPTLYRYFFDEVHKAVFDTWEFCVYDGDKLIAASFVDLGKESICSILAVFHPDYGQYSLGMYTIFLELQYAESKGLKFYYPGYIFDQPSIFDYKKRLKNLYFYDWRGGWHKIEDLPHKETIREKLISELSSIQDFLLESYHLRLRQKDNPAFFSHVWHNSFHIANVIKSPIYLEKKTKWGHRISVEYLSTKDVFLLSPHSDGEDHFVSKDKTDVGKELIKVIQTVEREEEISVFALQAIETLLQHEGEFSSELFLQADTTSIRNFLYLEFAGKYNDFRVGYDTNEGFYSLSYFVDFEEDELICDSVYPEEIVEMILKCIDQKNFEGLDFI
ncbi:GNAT family N-acetyltransferase [Sediminitomix flava]|uniref:Arginyl-tRNA--protein-N-Asp/Glu arginylyltransferase n=1 Tax=Sediminitomix flava TaxID=379075 RepID=A0A316A2Z5_SEDFL|nr:GNAT family N-acetyltransferase [Sediminitomix flava]PWJ44077.1 arginyl-tRNA--protein-N-Asp/Glu arginylyltransferase [Sediminitomix flava]